MGISFLSHARPLIQGNWGSDTLFTGICLSNHVVALFLSPFARWYHVFVSFHIIFSTKEDLQKFDTRKGLQVPRIYVLNGYFHFPNIRKTFFNSFIYFCRFLGLFRYQNIR